MTSRWPILVLVTLAHGLGALTALAVAPLAPFLLESLALSRVQVGLFLPAVYLGGALMALPAGWLTDRLGVRLALGLGQLLVGVMITLAALSPNLAWLLTLLVLGGFGFSALNPATGKAVSLAGATIAVIRDGKLQEGWNMMDMGHFFESLRGDGARF